MTIDQYELEANPSFLDFEFCSVGPKGKVQKIVRFTKMDVPDATLAIYNLGFGDYSKAENKIDDLVVTDNKDGLKVMATVVAAVITFTGRNPEALVFVQGSTPVRTRYFIMGITRDFEEIRKMFQIWGNFNDRWELFQRNKSYTALLVKRK